MFYDRVAKTEVPNRFDQPVHAGDDAVGTPRRQAARKYLEHRIPASDTGLDSRSHHGEFVMIGM